MITGENILVTGASGLLDAASVPANIVNWCGDEVAALVAGRARENR